jgi:hypothetical protein
MHIFVFAPESNGTLQLVHRLKLRGYNAEHASPRHFAAAADTAELRKQMRARIMRLITWCDAVAVPDGAITPEELSRLLVVCEFAGKRIVRYEDLPGEAPEDGKLPVVLAIGTTVAMRPYEHAVTPDRMKERLRLMLARTSAFFDHGRWLKNPMVSGRA